MDSDRSVATQSPAGWLEPLYILLLSRLGVCVVAYLGLALLHGPPRPGNAVPGNLFFDGWTRWDAGWYARIAAQGHTGQPMDDSGQTDAGHFPLYPWTVRAVAWVLGDVHVAGILVSNVAFVAAGLLLWRLIQTTYDTETARRAIVLWCVWPFSYTFSAMYTESPFVLCVSAAFLAGERRRWWLAGVCAGLAGFTRLVGTVTVLALIVMYLHRSAGWRWRAVRRDVLWLLPGFGGIIAFAGMLWWWFGDPLLFVRVHGAGGWHEFNSLAELRHVGDLWRRASFGSIASGNVPLLHTIHALAMVLAAGLCVLGVFKLPPAWSVWLILTVAISYYRWACFGRHFATCWPAFVVLALLLQGRAFWGVAYAMAMLLALMTIMFTQGYWVA